MILNLYSEPEIMPSNANYSGGNETTYSTEVLKLNFFHKNDAYILVKSDITIRDRSI